MWRLRKSTVYITNLLFSAILAGYILSYCFLGLFPTSHDWVYLFSGFTFFVFFGLPVIYLLSLIFAWSFGKIFPFIYAKTFNRVVSQGQGGEKNERFFFQLQPLLRRIASLRNEGKAKSGRKRSVLILSCPLRNNSNIPLSSLLTGIVLMGLSAFLYYLLFFDYYQNPTPPLGAPKDYFRHLSAYKSELSTFAHVVFASVVMSYLTYKYGYRE